MLYFFVSGGQIYRQQCHCDHAKYYFEQMLRINPDDVVARAKLGAVRVMIDDLAEMQNIPPRTFLTSCM